MYIGEACVVLLGINHPRHLRLDPMFFKPHIICMDIRVGFGKVLEISLEPSLYKYHIKKSYIKIKEWKRRKFYQDKFLKEQ